MSYQIAIVLTSKKKKYFLLKILLIYHCEKFSEKREVHDVIQHSF